MSQYTVNRFSWYWSITDKTSRFQEVFHIDNITSCYSSSRCQRQISVLESWAQFCSCGLSFYMTNNTSTWCNECTSSTVFALSPLFPSLALLATALTVSNKPIVHVVCSSTLTCSTRLLAFGCINSFELLPTFVDIVVQSAVCYHFANVNVTSIWVSRLLYDSWTTFLNMKAELFVSRCILNGYFQ